MTVLQVEAIVPFPAASDRFVAKVSGLDEPNDSITHALAYVSPQYRNTVQWVEPDKVYRVSGVYDETNTGDGDRPENLYHRLVTTDGVDEVALSLAPQEQTKEVP